MFDSGMRSARMRHRFEYALAWILVRGIGMLPRRLARTLAIALAWLVFALHARLRRVGMRNLELAFPDKSKSERQKILRGTFTSLGRQLAEVCLFPSYTRENVSEVIVYDGFENFDHAQRRGRGVLYLTAHLGGWELSAFAHSLQGHPLRVVTRSLDNPYLEALIKHYRTMHGNTVVDKDNFVRGLLSAMKMGDTVGILMDTNITPPQGVFVDFFGTPACTASGLARIALRSHAAVVPGFTIWDAVLGKYRLCFEPAVNLIRTADEEADVVANTALFTRIIEDYVRRYPDQWLWVHRRWKSRPPGEKSLY